MEFIKIGPAYIMGWARGIRAGMGGGKAYANKQDDTNSRVLSSYDMYIYPQRVNFPLQDLDRSALTVGTISGPKLETSWCHFTSRGFAWLAKSTLEKQTSRH